jgi:hypothetical protein
LRSGELDLIVDSGCLVPVLVPSACARASTCAPASAARLDPFLVRDFHNVRVISMSALFLRRPISLAEV